MQYEIIKAKIFTRMKARALNTINIVSLRDIVVNLRLNYSRVEINFYLCNYKLE